jgi:hypothetical protein
MAIYNGLPGDSLGGSLGRSLSGGLQTGTMAYLQRKKEKQASSAKANALQAEGFSKEEAESLANAPDTILKEVIKNKRMARESSAYSNATKGLVQGGEPSMSPKDMKQQEGDILDRLSQIDTTELNPQRLNDLIKFGQKDRQINIQQESNRISEEKPDRAALVKRVDELDRRVEGSKHLKDNYKILIKNAHNPELRSGNWRKGLDKFGLDSLGQSSMSDYMQKVVSDISVQTVMGIGGKPTAKLLEEVAKSRPNLLLSPDAIVATSKLQLNKIKQEEILSKALQQVKKENGGRLPLDAYERAHALINPKLQKLQKQAQDIGSTLLSHVDDNEVKVGSVLKTIDNVSRPTIVRDTSSGKLLVLDGKGGSREATPEEVERTRNSNKGS